MPDRRTFLAGAATTTLGAGAFLVSPDPVGASVALNINDKSFTSDDGQIATPHVTTRVDYEYSVVETPTEVVLSLAVDSHVIDSATVSTSETDGAGSVPLTGAVTDAPDYSMSDFEAALGTTETATFSVTVLLEVRDGSSVIISEQAAQNVTVGVEHTGTGQASITATGEIVDGEP